YGAGGGEACPDGWVCKPCVNVAVEPRDDLWRRAFWRAYSRPCPCLVSRKRLGNGRHIRQHVKSIVASYAKRPQRTGAYLRQRCHITKPKCRRKIGVLALIIHLTDQFRQGRNTPGGNLLQPGPESLPQPHARLVPSTRILARWQECAP